MSIDISQFHQVFFEESIEGLDGMETALMTLSPDAVDSETINAIFRAAHSIKGGSATFGFSAIASFTHVLETLLDQIRNGERAITREYIDLFLQSVDCIRNMLASYQQGSEPEQSNAKLLQKQFEVILGSEHAVTDDGVATRQASDKSSDAPACWEISLAPHDDMLCTGNDPLRMLRELATLGDLDVKANCDAIPYMDEMRSESCYLTWNMQLHANVNRHAIESVFEWVTDDAEIVIEQHPSLSGVATVASEPVVAPQHVESVAVQPVVASKAVSVAETSSIRVAIDKIDALINMVGELVITQSMLGQLGSGDFDVSKLPKLQEGLSQLEHNTRELQESVMRIRMLPISFAFSRFPRMVRDLAQRLDKKIDIVMVGENTELDKTVMEKIGDPLVHLVRNSVDHGIESVEKRLAAGKSETGKITLNAFHQGGNVMIEISDDGAGLNVEKILSKAKEKGLVSHDENITREQIHDLIFAPGFSTADAVSDLSGRGVGMDVVRRNIRDLGGTVDVRSEPGKGSIFTVRLPLTLAILDGQLINVGAQTYILPLVSIVESLQVKNYMVNAVGGGCSVLRLRNEYIPIVRLYEVFNIPAQHHQLEDGLLVVVESAGEKIGLLVDDLQAQQQVVIKSLEQNYQKIEGISGATILGDGTVALIIDVSGIVRISGEQHRHLQAGLVFSRTSQDPSAQHAA